MPDRLKAGIETLFGLSLDDVQVHYNSSEPTKLQALAYMKGAEIHVRPGTWCSKSRASEADVASEGCGD